MKCFKTSNSVNKYVIKTEQRPSETVYKEEKDLFQWSSSRDLWVYIFSFHTKIALKGLFFQQLFSPDGSQWSFLLDSWKTHILQHGALSQSPGCSVWLYPSEHKHIEKQALGNYLF